MSGPDKKLDDFSDYYKVLECARTATNEELKKSYQRLVITMHPDKAVESKESESFLLLQKAWSVLRDPQSRKLYDAELSCHEYTDCLLYDTISLTDMENCLEEQCYKYPCRCGNKYFLEYSDLQQGQPMVTVPCDECSFSVQVNLK